MSRGREPGLGRSSGPGLLDGWETLTEEDVLDEDGLLRQAAKVAAGRDLAVWPRLLLDARPCQVDVEQQEQDAEPGDRGLEAAAAAAASLHVSARTTHVAGNVDSGHAYRKTILIQHQGIVQQMSVDLCVQLSAANPPPPRSPRALGISLFLPRPSLSRAVPAA